MDIPTGRVQQTHKRHNGWGAALLPPQTEAKGLLAAPVNTEYRMAVRDVRMPELAVAAQPLGPQQRRLSGASLLPCSRALLSAEKPAPTLTTSL
jgi:hypothetical protein